MDGLGPNYDAFVNYIHVYERTNFTQFHQLVIQQERNIKKRMESRAFGQGASTFPAQSNRGKSQGRSHNKYRFDKGRGKGRFGI